MEENTKKDKSVFLNHDEKTEEEYSPNDGFLADRLDSCLTDNNIKNSLNQDSAKIIQDGVEEVNQGVAEIIPDSVETENTADSDSTEQSAPAKRKKHKWLFVLLNTVMISIIVFLIIMIVFTQLIIFCPVSQTSMLPKIQNGQNVLLIKTKNIKRDQIFVFKTEKIDPITGENINLIKRAMGIGGDRLVFVSFGEGQFYDEVFLYRDTGRGFTLLKENYLNKDEDYQNKPMVYQKMGKCSNLVYFADGDPETFDIKQAEEQGLLKDCIISVADQTYFAMGDNRNVSEDSRNMGAIQKGDIIGRYLVNLTPDSFIEKVFKRIYKKNKNMLSKETGYIAPPLII